MGVAIQTIQALLAGDVLNWLVCSRKRTDIPSISLQDSRLSSISSLACKSCPSGKLDDSDRTSHLHSKSAVSSTQVLNIDGVPLLQSANWEPSIQHIDRCPIWYLPVVSAEYALKCQSSNLLQERERHFATLLSVHHRGSH